MTIFRALRPALAQFRRASSDVAEIGWKTRSREEFARAFPKTAAKQDYHLKVLSESKIPVHRSGKYDDAINQSLYAVVFLSVCYTVYNLVTFRK